MARSSTNVRDNERQNRRPRAGAGNEGRSGNKIMVGSFDYVTLLVVLLLVLFGIIMVFSSSYYTTGSSAKYSYDMYYYLKRNVFFSCVGLVMMMVASKFHFELLQNLSKMIYVAVIVLLILVLFFGKEVGGAKRWIFGFQPSEVAKSALILYLSTYIVRHKGILKTWRGFLQCSVIVLLPAGLVGIENLSTAIVLCAIGFGIIFMASPRLIYFVPLVIFGAIGVSAMIFGTGFRAKRVIAWKDPFSDPLGVGFQTIQSLYAIASGGFFGLGLGQSRQKLGYIPEGHNDIIFAIICEELGFFGAAILIMLFMMLIWRGVKIASNCVSTYGALVAAGITIMITVQVIINIAVVTNTIPNTGIPLPFISYGGTSLLFMMISMGILLNISRYYRE